MKYVWEESDITIGKTFEGYIKLAGGSVEYSGKIVQITGDMVVSTLGLLTEMRDEVYVYTPGTGTRSHLCKYLTQWNARPTN